MTVIIAGEFAHSGLLARVGAAAPPSSDVGLGLSPDFAATLASRTGMLAGPPADASAGAPVATSFAHGQLFGSATGFTNLAVPLAVHVEHVVGIAAAAEAAPTGQEVRVSSRAASAAEPSRGSELTLSSADTNCSAQTSSPPAAPNFAGLQGTGLGTDTGRQGRSSTVTDRIPAAAGDIGVDRAVRSGINEAVSRVVDSVTAVSGSDDGTVTAMLARGERVRSLSPVNVSLLQSSAGLSLIARVSGLGDTDETGLPLQLLRTVADESHHLSEMTLNGRVIRLTQAARS